MTKDKNTAEEQEKQDNNENAKDQNKTAKSNGKKKSSSKSDNKYKEEIAELKDKYLRLYSEFENYRRRTAKEKIDLISTATEDLMIELLPIIDDFERAHLASESDQATMDSIKEGTGLIFNKLKNVTEKNGLLLMETKPGDDFDTELHDAITQIPAPNKKLKGKIVDTVEKGYLLKDKVIRFAKVVIGA